MRLTLAVTPEPRRRQTVALELQSKMTGVVERIEINYKGKIVVANKLTLASEIKLPVDVAWEKVQTSDLLNFVVKDMVKFKPIENRFPIKWTEGQTVSTRMLIFGIIPIGGIHSIYFDKIDDASKTVQTKEWDDFAKVWNHKISIKELTENSILYEDEVVIYAGILTWFITNWAKSFYKHRQKRWKKLLANVGKL